MAQRHSCSTPDEVGAFEPNTHHKYNTYDDIYSSNENTRRIDFHTPFIDGFVITTADCIFPFVVVEDKLPQS
uniref:Uncharacterized protein n=1 Tax=Acrobeloides nanus TaxID=290746 RepID=A0A914C7T2_9BILA